MPTPTRVAIITMAAPWEKLPLLAVYWPPIVQSLRDAGAQSEIFYVGIDIPGVLASRSPRLQAFTERPEHYEYQGAMIHSIRGYFPHPVWLHWKVATKAPAFAAWLVRRAVERKLMAQLRTFKPTALLVHNGCLMGQLGLSLSKRLGVPFAVLEHDPVDYPAHTPIARYYTKIMSNASAVMAVQAQTVRHMLSELKLPRARLAHNGTVFPTAQQRATPRPEHWQGKKVLLHVGNAIPRKAHAETIRAFAKVAPPDAHLVFVSVPRPDLDALVSELGLQGRVEFLPLRPQREILQLMVWADLFVLPSWWEAFGLVYTEAMASETPVIMCADCGLAPYITHGVHGFIIPPQDQDALESTLRHALTAAALPAMGRAGRELVESRWTWERNAQVLLKALRGEPEPDPLDERLPSGAQGSLAGAGR